MSSELPFERIKHIAQYHKDIVCGFIRNIERSLQLVIPNEIVSATLLFYHDSLESAILTPTECDRLLSLFAANHKFAELQPFAAELRYRCSRDGFSEASFKLHCHGKKNVLCLIHNKENDHVFGGYTSIGWEQTNEYYKCGQPDDKAFLFSIRAKDDKFAPCVFDVNDAKQALRIQTDYVCMFGYDCPFYVVCNTDEPWQIFANGSRGDDYETFPHDMFTTAAAKYEAIQDLEVFLIQKVT